MATGPDGRRRDPGVLAAALPWLPGDLDHFGVRVGLWILAVLVEYGSGLVIGLSGWRLASPEHFVERLELIIIIAFGELIISVGIGSGVLGKPITWPTLVSPLVGLTTVACLWWAYFDSLTHAAALAMHGRKGDDQIALARDGYIYLHLPMIAGLILVALGGEEMVRFMAAHTANVGRPLHGLGSALLYVGVALYLLSLIGFQLRALGTLVWTRVIAFVLVVALVPLAGRLPSLVGLSLLAAVALGLVIAEIVFLAESRNALHDAVREEREAIEARDEWRREHR